MLNAGIARDELKHVRLIHFSLTLVSATILYLVAKGWSEAPELQREIESLVQDLARVSAPEPLLTDVDAPLADAVAEGLLAKASGLLDRPLTWTGEGRSAFLDSLRLKLEFPPPAAGGPPTLSAMLERLSRIGWRLEAPELADGEPAPAVAWLKANLVDPKSIGFVRTSGPYLAKLRPGEEIPGSEHRKGTLTLEINSFSSLPSGDRDKIPVVQVWEKSMDVRLRWIRHTVTLPSDWVSRRYPRLWKHWKALEAKTPEQALDWARQERTRGLTSLKTSILGVEVDAQDIGVMGPVTLLCLLLYLLYHLLHLNGLPTSAEDKPTLKTISPWSGTSWDLLGGSLNIASLVLLPSATVFLAFYRLLGFHGGWAFLAALAWAGLGIGSCRLGSKLAEKQIALGGSES